MAEVLEALTPRQRELILAWSTELQAAVGWSGSLPVALLDRCWLRLKRVPVEQLAAALPPDASGDAPELVRYRALLAAGQPARAAQLRCWQEFGQPACQDALRRFWSHQDRGNHGWTLQTYLQVLETYRLQCEPGVTRALPLIVLARGGQREAHSLHWLAPLGQPMRHTCA